MSVVGKIPYIETVLGRLNAANLSNLSEALNGGYSLIKKSLLDNSITAADKGVHSCLLKLKPELPELTGVLIYTDYTESSQSYVQCYFLEYTRTEKIGIYSLNLVGKTYIQIDEYCTIEELRRILNDYLDIEHSEQVVRVVPTEIVGYGSTIQLAHDGSPLSGQTPLSLKSINGISLIGTGDINTHGFYVEDLVEVSTGILKSTGTYEHHTLVAFEVETSGVHYGADFILHPYDGVSVCLVAFRIILNGSFADAYANLDENGHIVITLTGQIPSGAIFKCHTLEFVD